ncbi:MAG TPA: ASKHA domain-containing protein, partial [Gemmatimonadales bacterium]
WRLACQAHPVSDLRLDLPADSLLGAQRLQVEGLGEMPPLDPPVPATAAAPFGVAVDLGTTKLAIFLVDLRNGVTVASAGVTNPQIAFGEDVISRLAWAAATDGGARRLQQEASQAIAAAITALCAEAGARPDQVAALVVVGNTVMHHLLAGLPTVGLGAAPFAPSWAGPLERRASELGLPAAPGAPVYFAPCIAGFVGGDHVAMLMASGALASDRTVLALDIGTNTEISLCLDGRLISCSCPSGPAFEGAHLTHGMRAAPGAIEAVRLEDDRVTIRTVDGVPARGICGSGILDAVAEMRQAGVIDTRGNLRRDHPLLTEGELILAPAAGGRPPVTVHRRDVLEIQLAKAAIQSGIQSLLAYAGLDPGQLDEVVIAGAFGTWLDVRSAVRIGLLPRLPRERFRQVGNAAGIGARQFLLSRARRQQGEQLASAAEYVELATRADYSARYLRALWL